MTFSAHNHAQGQGSYITFDTVYKRFEDFEVLKGVNLTVNRGETRIIIGGSGAGKSVILKHLLGLLKPDKGMIYVDGIEITSLSEKYLDEVRGKFGMVFQGAALFDSLTVADNISFGLRRTRELPEGEIADKVAEVLWRVGLPGIEQKFPAELSGGMRKRVGLARAVAMDPEILLYDEPTTGLDPITSGQIDELIMKMQEELNVTSVVVTHDLETVFGVADRVALLLEGEMVECGTPDNLRETNDPYLRRFIRRLVKSSFHTQTRGA